MPDDAHVQRVPPGTGRLQYADSSVRIVPVAPQQVLSERVLGKYLRQVEVDEVSKKADKATTRQTAKGTTTLERVN